MSRKKESIDQQARDAKRLREAEQEKWVVPMKELEKSNSELVCIPLQTNPAFAASTSAGRASSGRRSFGNFNSSIDTFNDNLELDEQGKQIAQYVNKNAMNKEEMAAFFANQKKRKRE